MIHLDKRLGNILVPAILEFGTGDICIMPCKMVDGRNGIIFKQHHTEMPLNQDSDEYVGKNTDEIKPEVLMTFTELGSLDALQWAIDKIRENLQDLKQTK